MITYDYYRIFYYVATYKSFTKAAKALHNSQPNITRCMNNLESELGTRLFIRGNHGITLTEDGADLMKHVRIAFNQLTIAEQEIHSEQKLESGQITIGASETALRLVLLEALEHFQEHYPAIRTHIRSYSSPQAIQAIQNQTIDFAVVTTPIHYRKPLTAQVIRSFHEILICGQKYRHLAEGVHSIAELQDVPFISLSRESGSREHSSSFFLANNLSFHPAIEAATTDQILPIVEHNLGIGFFPDELCQLAIRNGNIFQIHLKEQNPARSVCLVRDSTLGATRASEVFMKDFLLHS